jgi:hypothetical protein
MKKYILTIMLFSLGFAGYAQVGIGTASPTLTLEVVGANDNGAVTGVDGVLVPRVNDTDMSSATAGTKEGQMVYNTVAKKFYYWNATAWTAVGGVAVVTVDMTSSPDSGTEVGQLVYSTNASSTGYYYWTGAAWTALVPEPDLVTKSLVTVSSDGGSYTASSTDDIIRYTGDGDLQLTLPDVVPVGKIYYIINNCFGNDHTITFSNTIQGQTIQTASPGTGSSFMHIGSGDYVPVSGY